MDTSLCTTSMVTSSFSKCPWNVHAEVSPIPKCLIPTTHVERQVLIGPSGNVWQIEVWYSWCTLVRYIQKNIMWNELRLYISGMNHHITTKISPVVWKWAIASNVSQAWHIFPIVHVVWMVWEFGYPATCFLQSTTPGTILTGRTQSRTIHTTLTSHTDCITYYIKHTMNIYLQLFPVWIKSYHHTVCFVLYYARNPYR